MVAKFPSCPRYLVLGSCKKISFSWCSQNPKGNTKKCQKKYHKEQKNFARQPPKARKIQELQNSSHLLFTNCCFLVLTIVPLKGNYKAPSQWRCTLECLYAPHRSQEGLISHLETLPQCPKAWNTSNRAPTEICQCGTHFASLSWCLSSCFLNTSFVAVGMSALKSSISLSTENAHCFLSFKISSKYFPMSN